MSYVVQDFLTLNMIFLIIPIAIALLYAARALRSSNNRR